KSQPQRERALGDFKSGKVKILIATDIAARGIDVSGVSHVFNFELPNVPDQYVHRIGRTARAGAAGIAVSFCADDEKPYLRDIEKLTRQKLAVVPLPEGFMAESAKIKSTRSPQPIGRDEQNGRNGRAMQNQRGPRANPVRGDQPRREGGNFERREGQPFGDRRLAQGEQRRDGAPRSDAPRGDAPRSYARPKGKFHARPARPAGAGGGRPR
ncbi:MAG: ATP-dependent helicase, partial [Sphingomonadales bacterium]